MTTTNILLVGNNNEQVNNWVKIFNLHDDWKAEHALTDEEAIEKFHYMHFDAVVLGSSLSDEVKRKLNRLFNFQNEETPVVTGGSNVEEKIVSALTSAQKNKTKFSFVDNPLKHAGLNINVQ